jgi:hypothetical protein
MIMNCSNTTGGVMCIYFFERFKNGKIKKTKPVIKHEISTGKKYVVGLAKNVMPALFENK